MAEKKSITLTEARAELNSAQNRIANLFQEHKHNPRLKGMCAGDYATLKAINDSIGKSLSYLIHLKKTIKMIEDNIR